MPLLLSITCLESSRESIAFSLDTVGLILVINVTSDLDVWFGEAEITEWAEGDLLDLTVWLFWPTNTL